MSQDKITLEKLIESLWVAPRHAEWTPKTNVLSLDDLKHWMTSDDIEVMGFVDAMIHDGRFRIEPELPLQDYLEWVKRYYGRCLRENPDGEWSDSSYSIGADFVGVFLSLWDDEHSLSREVFVDLKEWLATLYKNGDSRLRTCIEHATLEHLFERKAVKKFFADWKDDAILKAAYNEASLWRGKTPLSRKR
jgi:hypothetical protein